MKSREDEVKRYKATHILRGSEEFVYDAEILLKIDNVKRCGYGPCRSIPSHSAVCVYWTAPECLPWYCLAISSSIGNRSAVSCVTSVTLSLLENKK